MFSLVSRNALCVVSMERERLTVCMLWEERSEALWLGWDTVYMLFCSLQTSWLFSISGNQFGPVGYFRQLMLCLLNFHTHKLFHHICLISTCSFCKVIVYKSPLLQMFFFMFCSHFYSNFGIKSMIVFLQSIDFSDCALASCFFVFNL